MVDKNGVWDSHTFQCRLMFLDICAPCNFVPNIANHFIVDSLDLLQRDCCKIFRATSNVSLDMKLGGT